MPSDRRLPARVASTPPVIDVVPGTMTLEGAPREGLTSRDAMEYLRAYDEGFLVHDEMDVGSFVAVDRDGVFVFYHAVEDGVSRWDPERDAAEFDGESAGARWAYLPSSEMAFTAGGMPWWREIRDGAHTPPAPSAGLVR